MFTVERRHDGRRSEEGTLMGRLRDAFWDAIPLRSMLTKLSQPTYGLAPSAADWCARSARRASGKGECGGISAVTRSLRANASADHVIGLLAISASRLASLRRKGAGSNRCRMWRTPDLDWP